MKFEDDDLRYGLVLARLPRDHEWWHGHLVRSDLRYDCGLLGRTTTMLFVVQKFGIGVAPRSKQFFLTLEGEGIGEDGGVRSTGDWGEIGGSARQKALALWVRRTVVPLLHHSRQFRRAVSFVIRYADYEAIADLGRMRRLDVPPFEAE